MKILFLTNLLPYPLDSGGNIKTYATLTALKRGNCSVDVVCFTENKRKEEALKENLKELCNSIDLIETKLVTRNNIFYMFFKAFLSLFSVYPFVVYKYGNSEMASLLRKKVKCNNYSMVYFDHLQMFLYYELLEYRGKIILDQHNCENLIVLRLMENSENFFKAMFMKNEYRKLKKFEIRALQTADKVYVLSQQDLRCMKETGARIKDYCVMPISVMDTGIVCKQGIQKGSIKIMFLGTLTWEPNNHGIVWFVKNVIPLLEEINIDYILYIVGKNPSQELQELVQKKENIILTGYVESVDEYYQKADIMVVPLFIGGGQRVKIIEAFSKGIPVISTSIGAEGLGHEDRKDILIADDPKSYVNAVKELMESETYKAITVNERQLYENQYSLDTYCEKFAESLSDMEQD